jgi:putative DNA primase/helicase
MSEMQTLNPAPKVIVAGDWSVCATHAGVYKKGISAQLHLYEAERPDRAMYTDLGIPEHLDSCIRSFAFSAQLTPEDFKQPIQDLIEAITTALQDRDSARKEAQQARAQRQAQQAAGPASGGIPIAQRFTVQPDGVWYEDPPDPPVWVCAELRILGGPRDQYGDHHGHALQLKDRFGETKHWAMPLELLEDRRAYRMMLRRLGLQMNSSKQGIDLLQTYLDLSNAPNAMTCVEKVGWYSEQYVLPDATYGPTQATPQEQVVLQGLTHTVEGYRQLGTADAWRDTVGRLCRGNTRLLFVTSMGFAAPLLTRLDIEGGGVHLRGPSSEGKTTLLLVAASVWGEPGRVERWRATANGLEGVACAYNDNLLLLDELKEIDPREAGIVAYMLSNGSGKRRGRPDGGTRPRLTWRVLFLSSGEISLAQHVELAGQRVHAGQEVRLVDLAAEAGAKHGVFEDLHTHASGQEFADCLRRHVQEAHGTAGRAFLEHLVGNVTTSLENVKAAMAIFMQKTVSGVQEGQIRRVATRFAVIGAAGELATDFGLTGWDAGDALHAAQVCFEAWIHQRGGMTNSDEARAIAQVRLFLERYGEARFQPWEDPDDPTATTPCTACGASGKYGTGQCYTCQGTGQVSSAGAGSPTRIYDRAGFRRDTGDDSTEYFVLAEVFRKELSKGFDPVWLGKVLMDRDVLQPDSHGRATSTHRLPGVGSTRVYHLLPTIMEA